MEMKFSGFQFLFANSPVHIKPDRPLIAFGSRMRSVHKNGWENLHGGFQEWKRWDWLERVVEGAGAPGCLLTMMAAQEPLPTCRTPLAHRLPCFLRAPSPSSCFVGPQPHWLPNKDSVKTKGRFENHHEEPGLWRKQSSHSDYSGSRESEFYFWMKSYFKVEIQLTFLVSVFKWPSLHSCIPHWC